MPIPNRQILPPPLYPVLHFGLKTLFPNCLWELSPRPHGRQVALTFDDGPHPDYTPALLQVLADSQVPATFFVLGERVQHWPHLAHQIHEQGHQIGLHGWQHRSFTQLTRSQLHRSLECTQAALAAACGGSPSDYRTVRPPNGLFWPQTLVDLHRWGFYPVMWSVVPEDWLTPPVEVVLERILTQVRAGSIIVLHDGIHGGSQVAAITQQLIPKLQKQSFQFVRLLDP
ncbi:MAG: polysaccharide deacetylase family protein [Thermostichus sp. DG02_5_bins_236]